MMNCLTCGLPFADYSRPPLTSVPVCQYGGVHPSAPSRYAANPPGPREGECQPATILTEEEIRSIAREETLRILLERAQNSEGTNPVTGEHCEVPK